MVIIATSYQLLMATMKTEPLIEYLQKVHLQKMNSKEIQVGGGGL